MQLGTDLLPLLEARPAADLVAGIVISGQEYEYVQAPVFPPGGRIRVHSRFGGFIGF